MSLWAACITVCDAHVLPPSDELANLSAAFVAS